ncbi:PGF-pre-PGF domain-containing protein [Methanomethylovorans sp.]|uniref:PGF-pre-PGF domain-containing protein n=1 Tax=Methanomethylovorans sp. TaxID=2758717 RepID=UPI00351C7AA5
MQIKLSESIRFGMMLFFVMITAGVGMADNINMGVVSQFSGEVSDVVVVGEYAYLGQSQDFVILDISEVLNPSEVGRVTAPSEVYDVAISGSYAYVANGDNGLVVIDISTPSSPNLAGSYDTEGFACDVDVSGNYAYVADTSGLVIVDVRTSASLKLAGTYDTIGSANGVAISGNYAYVADDSKGIFDGSNGLAVIDISVPSSPSPVGIYDAIYAYDVVISGNHAYVADYNGLAILDVSDPSSPALAGSYSTDGDTNDVAVSGNYVYLTDYSGLVVLDVSAPSSPGLVSSYDTGGNANGIAVSDNYVYVADSNSGLVVLQEGVSGGSIAIEDNSTSDTAIEGSVTGALELSLIGDRSVKENELLTFTISTADADAGVVYSVSDLPAGATFDPNTGVFSWTPDTGSAGAYTVTFAAGLDGLTDSETITITVMGSSLEQTSSMTVTNLQETGLGSNWIRWEWTNPDAPDFSHFVIYIDDVAVSNTSESVYTSTGLDQGVSHSITIYSVDTSGNIDQEGVQDLATTLMLQDISSIYGNNITSSSITLVWEASNATTGVQILRDDLTLGNVSGSTSYLDTGLTADTTYNYTLIPYKEDGMEGATVFFSLRTPSSGLPDVESISSSEDTANLLMTDVASAYLAMNANVTYEFTGEGNDILSVSFYSLQDLGDVTSAVEVLNNRSKLVSSTPSGLVYKYINIWIGNSDSTTGSSIKDARVKFKVNDSWLQEMGLTAADVRLQRYDGGVWEVLPTILENNNGEYAVFESQTPGFSPFAITAEKELASSANADMGKVLSGKGQEQTQAERSNTLIIAMSILLAGVFAAGYFYLRKGHN